MGREPAESSTKNPWRTGQHLLVGLLLLVTSLTGCATLGPAPPDITLVDLQFTDLTLFETSGVFVVRLSNENPEPLAVEGGVYSLYVDGIRVAKGLSDHRFAVPPLSSVTDEVEVRLSNLAMATRVQSIFERGSFDYEIRAKVYVGGSFGRRTLRMEKTGFFDFDQKEGAPGKSAGGAGSTEGGLKE